MVQKGCATINKIDQRLEAIVEIAKVIAESDREQYQKTNVPTSVGRLAGMDVPFLVSYITQLEAVVVALRQEKQVMERFDQAIAAQDEAAIAEGGQTVIDAGRQVEKALEDLARWEMIME